MEEQAAIGQKLEEQREFVEWWKAAVSIRLHAGTEVNADPRSTLSKTSAEALTGITQQQVSKWRKRRADAVSLKFSTR